MLSFLVLIFSCLSVGDAAPNLESLCPVSQRYNTAKDHHYRPPLLLYSKSTLPRNVSLESYNCSSYYEISMSAVHPCLTNKDLCPVKPQNIHTAIDASPWPQYAEAFRRIHTSLSTTNSTVPLGVNVFILGGSMTHGSETHCACFCTSPMDSRCPVAAAPESCDTRRCSWSSHLDPWLHHHFPRVKWSIYDLAASGVDSKRMAEWISEDLQAVEATFTDNDIIFLDHSVNDVAKTDTHGILLPLAFELLVRRILAISYTNNVRPTIIVLEQYAHNSIADARKHTNADVTRHNDYGHIYRKVSKHYGLILWSIRDIYWSYFTDINVTDVADGNRDAAATERMYQISPFSAMHTRTHPPWYMHLFIADTLATCVLQTMHYIELGIMNNSSSIYTSIARDVKAGVKKELLVLPAVPVHHALPPPLYNAVNLSSKFSVCDHRKPYLVDVLPNSTFTPAIVPQYENDAKKAGKEGWRVYIDYHDTPGWIINEFSHPDKRTLSFPVASSHTGTVIHTMLRVLYLRSFTGMGRVNVHICGEIAYKGHETGRSTIDALDVLDPVSVPNAYIHILTVQEAARCDALPVAQRTVDIIYDPSKDKYDDARREHHGKFKLMRVEWCSEAPLV